MTDVSLNPVTPVTAGAVVNQANPLPVTIVGGGLGITVGTTTIMGGTTTQLLYDNGGIVGETPGVTYSSASATLNLTNTLNAGTIVPSAAALLLGAYGVLNAAIQGQAVSVASSGRFMWASTANPYDTADTSLSRSAAASIAVGNGTQGDASGTLLAAHAILSGALTYGGVTLASTVTGTGSMVLATGASLSSATITSTLTYGGVTFASTVTGSGSLVGATSPTLSSLSVTSTLTYGGVTAASVTTGTGNLVLSASPSLSGTVAASALTMAGLLVVASGVAISSATAASQALITGSTTASFGIYFGNSSAPSFAAAQGSIFMNSSGSSTSTRAFVRSSASTWIAFTTGS
jgi:hypothetical protein